MRPGSRQAAASFVLYSAEGSRGGRRLGRRSGRLKLSDPDTNYTTVKTDEFEFPAGDVYKRRRLLTPAVWNRVCI